MARVFVISPRNLGSIPDWVIPKTDSLLNITFIQLHHCFSLAQFNLIFFYLWVSAGFCLAFLYANPISLGRFFQSCHNHWLLFSTRLFIICFFVHSLFLRRIALSFLSWCSDVFHDRSVCFPSFTDPLLLHFHQIFDSDYCFQRIL